MLISSNKNNTHKKSSELSIQTRSLPASFSFKGEVTKHETVKWSIVKITPLCYYTIGFSPSSSHFSFLLVYLFFRLFLFIQSCIYLAQGTRFVDTLDDHVQKLLTLKAKRRASISSSDSAFRRTGSFIFTNSFSEKNPTDERWDSVSSDWVQIEDIITTMESLAFHCKKGKRCCSCTIACYRVAQVCSFLQKSFISIWFVSFAHSIIDKWAQVCCLFDTRCSRRIETGRKMNSISYIYI